MRKSASKRNRARAAPGSRDAMELDEWLAAVENEPLSIEVCDPREATDAGIVISTTFTTYRVLTTLPTGGAAVDVRGAPCNRLPRPLTCVCVLRFAGSPAILGL